MKHLAVFRDQAIQYLVEILKTAIGEVTVDHRLAQSYDAKSGKIELPKQARRDAAPCQNVRMAGPGAPRNRP